MQVSRARRQRPDAAASRVRATRRPLPRPRRSSRPRRPRSPHPPSRQRRKRRRRPRPPATRTKCVCWQRAGGAGGVRGRVVPGAAEMSADVRALWWQDDSPPQQQRPHSKRLSLIIGASACALAVRGSVSHRGAARSCAQSVPRASILASSSCCACRTRSSRPRRAPPRFGRAPLLLMCGAQRGARISAQLEDRARAIKDLDKGTFPKPGCAQVPRCSAVAAGRQTKLPAAQIKPIKAGWLDKLGSNGKVVAARPAPRPATPRRHADSCVLAERQGKGLARLFHVEEAPVHARGQVPLLLQGSARQAGACPVRRRCRRHCCFCCTCNP